MRRIAVPLLLALAASATRAADGAPDRAARESYVDELVVRARTLDLAHDPAWLRLGHWRRTPVGWKSEVDGLDFFRSLRGKTSPAAELVATLRALLDDRPVEDELRRAQCQYPARLLFLSARLGIDPARLPAQPCPLLEKFVAQVGARSATLVFSSFYLNNPVSSFGHTFLRLNKAEEARSGRHFELLDLGIDYSARPNTSNPIAYAFEGLLGGFPGRFNRLAYYYKVREYADAESRDLWEYDLALSPDEVRMLVAHVWELGNTWFQYWYLDENCSYHILGALEAAAPRAELLAHVGAVVLPSDTVKALFRNPGLVRSVHYRPSIRTQFAARVAGLDARERALVDELASRRDAPFPPSLAPERRAAVLDAAVDLVDLRYFRDLAVDAAPAAARTRQVLLERRSEILVQSPALVIPTPEELAPHRGHGSFRLGAGGAASSRDHGLAVLDGRIALHDLGDPPVGYPPLSSIEFLPTRLQIRLADARAILDEAWALRIVSLNELSRFDLRPSWRLRVGAATVRDRGCAGCLAGTAEVGAGAALASLASVLDLYAGADVAAEWSPRLAGISGSEVRAGIGPGGLARLRLGRRIALVADARWRWLPAATPRETFDLRGTLRIHVARGASLSLEGRSTPADRTVTAAVLAFF